MTDSENSPFCNGALTKDPNIGSIIKSSSRLVLSIADVTLRPIPIQQGQIRLRMLVEIPIKRSQIRLRVLMKILNSEIFLLRKLEWGVNALL